MAAGFSNKVYAICQSFHYFFVITVSYDRLFQAVVTFRRTWFFDVLTAVEFWSLVS